jgi:hypothetical protein
MVMAACWSVSQYIDPKWTDCLTLQFLPEGQRGWFYMHFSPARARLIAKLLIDRADRLEHSDPGMKCIDS